MCDHPSHDPARRRALAALAALPALTLGLRAAPLAAQTAPATPAPAAAAPAAAAPVAAAPAAPAAEAALVDLPAPGPQDTCPVCGMFVAKYPEWIATVLHKDGKADHFDGAKDLFKYLADPGHYVPGRTLEGIQAIGVTDYYGVNRIDARQARYAIGSDVLGPMGHELVPLANDADATSFQTDHRATRLLAFAEVTPAMLAGLDEGRFE